MRSFEDWVLVFDGKPDRDKVPLILNALIGYIPTAPQARADDEQTMLNVLTAIRQLTTNMVDQQITEEAMSLFKLRVQANMTLVRIEVSDKGVDLEDVMQAIAQKNYKAFNALMTIINAKGDAP